MSQKQKTIINHHSQRAPSGTMSSQVCASTQSPLLLWPMPLCCLVPWVVMPQRLATAIPHNTRNWSYSVEGFGIANGMCIFPIYIVSTWMLYMRPNKKTTSGFHSHGPPKWMFYHGKSHEKKWMMTGGASTLGNLHAWFNWNFCVLHMGVSHVICVVTVGLKPTLLVFWCTFHNFD